MNYLRYSILFGLALLLGVCYWQYTTIQSLKMDVVRITAEKAQNEERCNADRVAANKAIQGQNRALERLVIDTENYRNTVTKKERELQQADNARQESVRESLSKDSSVENQLRIINDALKEFSGEKS